MGRAVQQLSEEDLALAAVAHAVSGDTTRPHLCSAFGVVRDPTPGPGRGYICATDGHRMALVRSESAQKYWRADAPPALKVVPWDAPWVGGLNARALDDEPRVFPKSWDVALTFGFGSGSSAFKPALHVSIVKGSGRKEKRVRPFGPRMAIDWGEGSKLEQLKHELSITLRYLLDAVDFCGTGLVQVFNEGPLHPIVFVPYSSNAGARSIAEAERIAVVMPRRE
jgi:hypothetical protein